MDKPRPVYPRPAARLLRKGRRALERGARDEGLAHLTAAVALDPDVFCEPWRLLPLLEAEGRGAFRDRMLARLRSWYRDPQSRVHAGMAALSHKPAMRDWIADLGVPLPQLHAGPVPLETLDWAALPSDLVIKPENGANNDGVVVLKGGVDRMRGQPVGRDRAAYVRQLYRDAFPAPPRVLVEECLTDAGAGQDPDLVIPRDFKVFTVAGHAGFTRVHDRNAPGGKRSLASFNRAGRRLPPCLKGWREAPQDLALPEGYDALIAQAETISQKLPWLLRLDFYLTDRGPVFGEFTTFPNAGLDLTPFSRRTLLQMWELWPD